MAMIPSKTPQLISIIIISLAQQASAATSGAESQTDAAAALPECSSATSHDCRNNSEALKLKIIAIASILVTSMIGVCLPLFSRSVPSLQPDKDSFVLVKAFASGVILATGYMHVLPDSFEDLTSECLPENPWKKFPFTTFVAMLSAVLTLMVDSYVMSYFRKHHLNGGDNKNTKFDRVELEAQDLAHFHGIGGATAVLDDSAAAQLLRYRVVAQVNTVGKVSGPIFAI
ncbi:Fe(2) transport protein 1-like [Orobanche hederae]